MQVAYYQVVRLVMAVFVDHKHQQCIVINKPTKDSNTPNLTAHTG